MSSVTQKNPIRLFVCHVYHEDDDYHRVFEYLESASNFFYRNTSTPEQRPAGDKEAVRDDLRRQITDAEIVLVPAQLYRKHLDWVEFQLHCAKAFDKPVVVLEPFGSHETIAPAVRSGQRVLIAAHGNSLRALVKYCLLYTSPSPRDS